MRVGLVGLWFERGNAYLTYGLREMLLPEMDPYVYARTGYIVGFKGRESHMEHKGRWDVPNVTRLEEYGIDPEHCARWIADNKIDVVIWNEEYNHALLRRVRASLERQGHDCLQVAYLDWVGQENWVRDLPEAYHYLTCATQRTKDLIESYGLPIHKFDWSVDLDLFNVPNSEPPHLFFHNAGWVGTNFRKGSIAVLNAWQRAFPLDYKAPPGCLEPSLLIHTQKPVKEWPTGCRRVIREDPRIHVHEGTVTAPGLYHRGRVYVGPSLLEGLGLTFPEALSSGLPLITTDAPPMNEHGDAECCTYVKVEKTKPRGDGCAFLENYVDIESLAGAMKTWAQKSVEDLKEARQKARECAERMYNREINGQKFRHLLESFRKDD